jgi:hypothetical protein
MQRKIFQNFVILNLKCIRWQEFVLIWFSNFCLYLKFLLINFFNKNIKSFILKCYFWNHSRILEAFLWFEIEIEAEVDIFLKHPVICRQWRQGEILTGAINHSRGVLHGSYKNHSRAASHRNYFAWWKWGISEEQEWFSPRLALP